MEEEKVRERSNRYDLGLRALGFVCCLAAAVISGTNKETETVIVSLSPSLPPMHISVSAKWYYMSSFVYFMASNAIACTYATTSIALSIVTRAKQKNTTLLLLILDLIIAALLFSANGAVSFVGLIALKGNSHLQWQKVCGVFNNFCRRSSISSVLSWVGSFVFLLLVVITASDLHKRSRRRE